MRAVECELVALDFETTGSVPGFLNTPWQLGMTVLRGGEVVMSKSFNTLLRVPSDQPFNPYTPGRWAQRREEIALAPTLPELWPELCGWLEGRVLVAHHAATERGILQQFLPLQTFGPWIDTLTIARRAFPKQPDYKLENLLPQLGLAETLRARVPEGAPHDAFYDAVACGTLLEAVLRSPGWRDAAVENLSNLK